MSSPKIRPQKKLYYSTSEVAAMLGKSTKAARNWLRREGALIKRGGHYYTTAEKLICHFPEVFQALAHH